MSRVFTVTFSFRHQPYTAVVTLNDELLQPSMQIQLPDSELHYFIPQGLISYNEQNGLNLRINKDKQLTYMLVNNIVQAVESRLQVLH